MALVMGLSAARNDSDWKLARPFFGSSTILEIRTENAPTMITGIRVINEALIAMI